MLSPVHAEYILDEHRARVEPVNHMYWQWESMEPTGTSEAPSRTVARRLRRRVGVTLIRTGARLIATRPVAVLADTGAGPVCRG